MVIYPPVNIQKANWKIIIVNSYVKLPEGNKQVTESNMIDSIKKNSDLTGMDWSWLALRGCQTGLAEKFSLNMHSNGKVIQLHG